MTPFAFVDIAEKYHPNTITTEMHFSNISAHLGFCKYGTKV
jgi:hypothetical protein